jgi:uncharacterized protein YecT (DUF1311 family)
MKNLLFIFTIILSQQVFALDCKNAITTIQINQCASIEQKKVEKELNKVYARVMKQLKSEAKDPLGDNKDVAKQLRTAQRLWVKFRKADCGAIYSYYSGGTIRTAMYIGCMRSRAEQRIKELKRYEEEGG